MKQKHHHKKGMLTQLRGWLLVMMLTIPALQMQADDWVLNESKYNAAMEDDHRLKRLQQQALQYAQRQAGATDRVVEILLSGTARKEVGE